MPWPSPWSRAPPPGCGCWSRCCATRRLRRNHRLHAVRAHLLELAGRGERGAGVAYAIAARLATSIPEQRYLNAAAARARITH